MNTLRVDLRAAAARQYAALFRFDRSIDLDPRLRDLVRLRASQINGCAFCVDLHWKAARGGGESEERLYMLDAWRGSPDYDERERAALELCEAMARIVEVGVSARVWASAARQFRPEGLGQLMFAITAIDAWNRLAIATPKRPDLDPPTPLSESTPPRIRGD